MSAKRHIPTLFVCALFAVSLWRVASAAEETYYFPIWAVWWCHDKTDVVRVMDTTNKARPKLLMLLTARGKCAHGAFGVHYTFVPEDAGVKKLTSDETKYTLVGGRIFTGGETFRVFVAARPKDIRPYGGTNTTSTPGQGI